MSEAPSAQTIADLWMKELAALVVLKDDRGQNAARPWHLSIIAPMSRGFCESIEPTSKEEIPVGWETQAGQFIVCKVSRTETLALKVAEMWCCRRFCESVSC